MKLLIADDEKTIRAGLIKIIKDHYTLPLEILEAKNGEEAWKVLQEEHPDILITDIRMPKLDGIELMRLVSTLEERPVMIVLSGYDEFAYARESIRHGVQSYILKPVDKQEFLETLDRLVQDLQDQQRDKEAALLRSAMAGKVLEKDALQSLISRGSYRIVKVIRPVNLQISVFIHQYNSFVIEEKNNALVLLVPDAKRTEVFSAVQDEAVFIGSSESIRNPSDLQSCRTHADIAACVRFFKTEENNALYEVLYDEGANCSEGRSFDSLAVLIGSGDKAGIERHLQDLFSFNAESLFQNVSVLYQTLSQIPAFLVTFHQYIDADPYLAMKSFLLQDLDRYNSLAEMKKDLSDFVLYLDIILKQRYSAYPFIEQALVYVAKHFTEDISMAVVANHCSVNYTYFSEKFKLVVGVNFNEYIKQLRLEEAKRLLQQGCYKVYEVAERSGFGDVKYFMKTFKEATGLSPGDFQKRFNTQ